MRKLIIILTVVSFMFSCEKSSDVTISRYTARVADYDLNCSTCLLEFPDDSMQIREKIGASPGNLYHAVNLNKNDLQIGQMLKVEIRKAEPAELTACLTLYPSTSYEYLYVTNVEDFDSFFLNDTILLSYQNCAADPGNQTFICFESVIGDSRCPTGAQCFWEGNAQLRFKFERINEKPILFDLNTHKGFTNDTIVDGYKFTLLNVYPYPTLKHTVEHKDYKAELLIENESLDN